MSITQEEQILEAAYRCIARDGYAKVSLRQVAHEAGVVVSQISYHFQNKEGLLLAVVSHAIENYYGYLQRGLLGAETPNEKSVRFITLFQEVLQSDPELFQVIYDSVGLALWSEPFRVKIRDLFTELTTQITTVLFSEGIGLEKTKELSPQILARIFFGGLFGIAIQALLDPEDQEIRSSLTALNALFQQND